VTRRAGPTVVVQKAVRDSSLPAAAALRAWVRAAAPGVEGEVTVRVVAEDESAALNLRYRGRAAPTNVLAFPAGEDSGPFADEIPPLGDLVICAPVLAREAREQGKTLEAHWAHIVIHGTLHLIGYDHDDDDDARAMEARERKLLAGLGFPDPYSAERQ
jgi:probable rRNA maturation factor